MEEEEEPSKSEELNSLLYKESVGISKSEF
jgi:hypothetical protein